MYNNNKRIAEEFERELWSYLDGDLPDERMKYWAEQISSSGEIRSIYEETKAALKAYNESCVELDAEHFNSFVERAVQTRNIFKSILDIFSLKKKDNERSLTQKMIFSGAVAAVSVIILLFSNKPNPIKDAGGTVLDWDDDVIGQKINNINTGLNLINDDRWKEYIQYQIERDKWKSEVYSIDQQIKQINKELDDKSL